MACSAHSRSQACHVRPHSSQTGVGDDGSKALPHAIAAASVLAGWLRDCPSAVSALMGVPDAMQGIIAAVAHGYVRRKAGQEALIGCVRTHVRTSTFSLSYPVPAPLQLIPAPPHPSSHDHHNRTHACDENAMGLVAVLLGECMLFGGDCQVRRRKEVA